MSYSYIGIPCPNYPEFVITVIEGINILQEFSIRSWTLPEGHKVCRK